MSVLLPILFLRYFLQSSVVLVGSARRFLVRVHEHRIGQSKMFRDVVPFSAVNAQTALNRSGSALKVAHDVQMLTMVVWFAAYALAWRALGDAVLVLS